MGTPVFQVIADPAWTLTVEAREGVFRNPLPERHFNDVRPGDTVTVRFGRGAFGKGDPRVGLVIYLEKAYPYDLAGIMWSDPRS